MQPEIHKMLKLSTAHLTKETAGKLENDGLETMQCVYGFLLCTAPGAEPHADDDVLLRDILAHARDLDCEYVYFDRDGPTSTEFPVFDW